MRQRPRRLARARRHIDPALPEVIAELAHELDTGILTCRERRRHDWRPETVIATPTGYLRVESCTDCASSRSQDLDRSGYITTTSISYVDGYLNPAGTGRVDRAGAAAYRLESITRLIEGVH
jgi:hypothetical protein